jgi:hypothetical protein
MFDQTIDANECPEGFYDEGRQVPRCDEREQDQKCANEISERIEPVLRTELSLLVCKIATTISPEPTTPAIVKRSNAMTAYQE